MLDIQQIKDSVKNWKNDLFSNDDLIKIGMFKSKDQIYRFNKAHEFSKHYSCQDLGKKTFNVYKKENLLNFFEDKELFNSYLKLFENIKPEPKPINKNVTVSTEDLGYEIAKFLMEKYVLCNNV